MSKVVNLVRLRGVPIFRQLLLEESLLRGSLGNWCVLNDGAPELSVVMGISAKVDQVMHRGLVAGKQVKVIRRYSGGGTVIIDKETLFATLIFEQKSIPDVTAYPRPIMKWSEGFYSSVFSPWGSFSLKENDYAYERRKFGGNAQTITKDKWVHHTSFLWDYDSELMALLKQPPKQPDYRKSRVHDDFLCRLSDYLPSKDKFFDGVADSLEERGFSIKEATEDEARASCKDGVRISTKYVEI
ncbi:hypothetical protein BSKO_08798 [Bryopsis sp. KO-2023]|nr:hypothetical protein BSKO_08798 [Bryopsis sp. KO-2023]